MKVSKDSMLVWYPKIKDLDMPQPRTEIIMLTEKELKDCYRERIPHSVTKKVKKVIDEKFKLPVFIRTDLASGKHGWEDTCYYDGSKELFKNVYEVIVFNLIADIMGLPFKALAVREFIPMDTKFTAFYGNMPVNPERRYFVENGKVLCHHPYWIEEAIEKSKTPSVENWRELAKNLNSETEEEIKLLTSYAKQVSEVIDGFWSIDFCRAKDGRWILIDMATGENSWHPKNCKFNRRIEIDYLKEGVKPLTEKDFKIIKEVV